GPAAPRAPGCGREQREHEPREHAARDVRTRGLDERGMRVEDREPEGPRVLPEVREAGDTCVRDALGERDVRAERAAAVLRYERDGARGEREREQRELLEPERARREAWERSGLAARGLGAREAP